MTVHSHYPALCLVALVSLIGCNEANVSTAPIPTAKVLVSTRAIVAGEEFTAENCRMSDWPLPFVPEGHVERLAEIEGQVALGPIPNNSAIARIEVGRLVAPIRMTRSEAEQNNSRP